MVIISEAISEPEMATENLLEPPLWHACAGAMVQMPALHSTVYYFPQGHAEHVHGVAIRSPQVPPLVLCQVVSVTYSADAETDEVFAKISLQPIRSDEFSHVDSETSVLGSEKERIPSFAKTLTQSDANNGGGFSVPRYCAETIFPALDYEGEPPVQTLFAKDLHGKVWKFRHVYRGTPRRHLLTTGWSTFINEKKLMAGDSVVFMRLEDGELRVGTRRAKRGEYGWNHPNRGLMKDEERKSLRNEFNGCFRPEVMKVTAEDFLQAANRAARGQPFDVTYYPRSGTPEFVVKASAVHMALRIQWCPGMRFKMPFETEDSSRISWFLGTVSFVKSTDELNWPKSPWRSLQVTWDEPDLLQNVKCVNPWLVVLVSNVPPIHLSSLNPPLKKLCVPQHPLIAHPAFPLLPGKPPDPGSNFSCSPKNPLVGIQGVRHTRSGVYTSDFRFSKLHPDFLHTGIDNMNMTSSFSNAHFTSNNPLQDSVSCALTIAPPCQTIATPCQTSGKSMKQQEPHLVLFGKQIFTAQQLAERSPRAVVSSGVTGNSSFDASTEKTATSAEMRDQDSDVSQFEAEASRHCRVVMDSENVEHTIDLSAFASYEELCVQLAQMFGIRKAELMSCILYQDSGGILKHIGDEPFSEFMGAARKLTIRATAENGL